MNTDIVVVNYKTPRDLEKFCESLRGQEINSFTIVNNTPTEEDIAVADRYSKELGGWVCNNDENIGYARAINEASTLLAGDIIATFNADVICPEGSIKAMADFMAQHPNVGVAGPKQVDSKNRITSAGVTGTNQQPKLRGWHQIDRGQFDEVRFDCVSVSGSAFFVKRSCWEELKLCPVYRTSCKNIFGQEPLGPMLPCAHFYEETALSYHARSHGWRVAFNGGVSMQHEWQGACKDNQLLSRYARDSKEQFRIFCSDHGIAHN